MILMVFDLGGNRQLIIPADNFLSICDDDAGGSLIKYNLDDVEQIQWETSKLPAKDALKLDSVIRFRP